MLAGRAAEFERDLPFSVWADALDAYVASRGGAVAAAPTRSPSWRASCPRCTARVGGRRGTLADERYRAHRGVRRLLGRLADGAPLVLVLDDLQWSDGASIELLAALLRRGRERPCCSRSRSGRGAARRAARARARGAGGARGITLAPLERGEAAALLAGLERARRGGGDLPARRRQPVLPRAARARTGRGRRAAGTDERRPPASRRRRGLARGGARGAVRRPSGAAGAAAVAGEPFEPALAGAIAGLDEDGALTALDGLLALDLVRPTAVPRRFAFRHPLVRSAVYERCPAGGG